MTARAASLVSQQIISTNPARPDEILGRVAVSSQTDVDRAVNAARKAQAAWRALGVAGRVRELRKLHDYIRDHRREFEELETREMGRAISSSKNTLDWTFRHLTWNLDNAEKVLAPVTTYEDDKVLHQTVYEPYGVYGVIAPWNFPLDNWLIGRVPAFTGR